MIRRHFFLIGAILALVLMAGAGTWKLMHKDPAAGGPGGPGGPGAAAGGRGGPAGGPAAGAPGARGGPGGPGGPGGRGGGSRGGTVVSVATVMPHTFADRLQVLGVAKGRESVTLTSVTSEYVERVLFRPGDQVQRNQVLIELRRNEEDASILQARTDLAVAKANADRYNTMAARGVAPIQQAEQFQATYDKAKAALDIAESRAGDRVIRAPFSGRIGLSDIAPGALISPGSAIATLDDTTVMRVDFDIPDRFLSLVREGGRITATTDAYPGEQYVGRIAKLDTRIDERTRTLKARAEFPNPGDRLRPGMLMRVGVDRGTRQSPAAPESSVQFTGSQAFVYMIGRNPSGGAFADLRNVTVGEIQDGLVEIRDGLAYCDQIVADGLNKIQPGASLTVAGGRGGGRGGPAGAGAPKQATQAPAAAKQGGASQAGARGGRSGEGGRAGGRSGPNGSRGPGANGANGARGGPPAISCPAPGAGRGGPEQAGGRQGQGQPADRGGRAGGPTKAGAK